MSSHFGPRVRVTSDGLGQSLVSSHSICLWRSLTPAVLDESQTSDFARPHALGHEGDVTVVRKQLRSQGG